MAKKQTFTSKLSKQDSNFKYVKHIKSIKSEDTGHIKFLENMVRLEENENLDQALKRMEEESKQVLSFGEVLEEASMEEQPTEEAPVEEASAEEESKEEAPAEEPTEEAPAEEQPTEEAPVEEAPAEEAEPATEDESAEQAEESSDK
jgi:septal ring-binding cell division protein DamX|tara:strand:- start:33 stop:473 length:441 start_codon:yes stop_codon:yes gene_type:complete